MTAQAFRTNNDLVITLDGPAASGKSTVARTLATHLDISFVSSGLLYRAIAYVALQESISPENEVLLLNYLTDHRLELKTDSRTLNQIHLDDIDITSHLNTDIVDQFVSAIAKHPKIRVWVNERLHKLKGPFVVEGRDMGSTVFPKAKYKFYLTASPEVRAKRRSGERGVDLAQVGCDVLERDKKDVKQLEAAKDAIHIDTSELGIEQVVEQILKHIA